jgi:glyoxylase-like metal-dependent hydrolase (beta-lactamase superfamily II)
VGDGNTGQWIRTLERARRLGAKVIGPGHGPVGTGALLADQQLYFTELRRLVRSASAGKSAAQVQASADSIRRQVVSNPRIAKFAGEFFPAQVAQVYRELTGRTLPDRRAEQAAQRMHLVWHTHAGGHTHP